MSKLPYAVIRVESHDPTTTPDRLLRELLATARPLGDVYAVDSGVAESSDEDS